MAVPSSVSLQYVNFSAKILKSIESHKFSSDKIQPRSFRASPDGSRQKKPIWKKGRMHRHRDTFSTLYLLFSVLSLFGGNFGRCLSRGFSFSCGGCCFGSRCLLNRGRIFCAGNGLHLIDGFYTRAALHHVARHHEH